MCTAIKEMIEEGRREGKEEGRKEGKEEGKEEGRKQGRKEGMKRGRRNGLKDGRRIEKVRIVRRMIQNNMSDEEICGIAGCSKEFIQKARQNKFEQMPYLK